jgi:hypothetical protein
MIRTRSGLFVASLANFALASTACLSSPSTEMGSGSGGGSGSGSESTSGGSTSSGNPGSGNSSGAAAGTVVMIAPDANGFVGSNTNAIGIEGSWYAYGDGWGSDGAPPGNCETIGMHLASECSSITFPPPAMESEGGYVATFPQSTPGQMCLSGTAAKVIGTDYSNMFGIGIGLDLNNVGGTKMPYNATTNGVTAFSFNITGIPAGVSVNVELPIPATDPSGDSWSMAVTADGDYTINLTTSGVQGLKPSFTMAMEPAFDPTQIESVQFHIATNIAAAITIPDSTRLCVSNFAAVVKP